MPKSKKVILNSVQLQHHPKLITLLSGDVFSLSVLPTIHMLTIEQVQLILDSPPIPVARNSSYGTCEQLVDMPLLDLQRIQPSYQKLIAPLLINKKAEPALTALTLIKPTLVYQDQKRLPEMLHHLICTSKAHGFSTLSKKRFSELAQLSPSAIRAKIVRGGMSKQPFIAKKNRQQGARKDPCGNAMKTKQRLISSFTLEYHPMVASILSDEITVQFTPYVVEQLHEHEIQLLLQTLTLHVIASTSDHYLLLMPEPLFALLREHPCAQSQKVSLCVHPSSDNNIEQTITTLMLTLPALQYNYQSSSLKILATRLDTAKSNPALSSISLPKKNRLALLARVSPSAIRTPTHKIVNNDDKDLSHE
ncbi:hypothetical protein L1D44_14130 [Shewanella sp. Isolate13]|uniref:hypothetical protein n=1 Tax=Shewanella sp. Isolate13 TaxID=2908531 RepID=UPI001EFEAFFE|nr:hypothetical protein [Shewanella sp. Isolate13]MCG9730957.1 hypothetical protein [Shewanella sp. Isolate13]